MLGAAVLATLALGLSATASAAKATSEELLAEQFCEKFPTLHMCRLREELMGSLIELQFLLQDSEAAAQANLAIPVSEVQKRKSAFVRFGKRSASEEDDVMTAEKRKSAFVRFGRSAPSEEAMQKRKSQYIRFGRK
ncbi:unnamed protein product [Caenorhabditis auriculariae]|uniref:Uncharacterized protein n=1 Tax=Caenorhabditis auriculariae TaxID=2777116 RepID=A0A8S1HUQ3_9PELO|nr:unnamed protein product [Caenorhabditis auriculariae]